MAEYYIAMMFLFLSILWLVIVSNNRIKMIVQMSLWHANLISSRYILLLNILLNEYILML